jgi:predicted acetyltransferase
MDSPDQSVDPGFIPPGRLEDGDLSLVLESYSPADLIKGLVPAYHFRMVSRGTGAVLGRISFRAGHTEPLVLYRGHIGYTVAPEHRGRHYAARSVRLLVPFAQRHGMGVLWITCNPENLASRRTCELAGAELVEVIDLPPSEGMYHEGERQKCRYRLPTRQDA